MNKRIATYPGTHKFIEILDPWHEEAFVGTPAEGIVQSNEPRRKVWGAVDAYENIIGTMDPVEGMRPEYVNGEWQWVPDKQ